MQEETKQYYPKPSWVEHDPLETWERQLRAGRQVLEKAGLTAGDIAAIGITNRRQTAVIWQRPCHRRFACPRLHLLTEFGLPTALLPRVKDTSDFYGIAQTYLFGAEISICAAVGGQQAALFGQVRYTRGRRCAATAHRPPC